MVTLNCFTGGSKLVSTGGAEKMEVKATPAAAPAAPVPTTPTTPEGKGQIYVKKEEI